MQKYKVTLIKNCSCACDIE